MLEDKALGLDMTAVGGLTSILPVAYGFSKFLSGVLGARTSPRILLAGGLAATALVNIAFGMSSAYPLLLAFWGLNGILQVCFGCMPANAAACVTLWMPGFHDAYIKSCAPRVYHVHYMQRNVKTSPDTPSSLSCGLQLRQAGVWRRGWAHPHARAS